MSIESMTPSNHLTLCRPLLLLVSTLNIVAQSPSRVRLFATPRMAARQASLSLISQSLSKFMSIALVMSSSYLIL